MFMQQMPAVAKKPEAGATFGRVPTPSRTAANEGSLTTAPSSAIAAAPVKTYRFDRVAVTAPVIQAKLEIGPPGDAYEQEADRVAEMVVQMPEPHAVTGAHRSSAALPPLVQQRASTTGPVVQRDVVDDVRERLSYGLFDWAITDNDALISLTLLGRIPPADLPAALARLGSKYITRLLDNLPDAAKTGDVYKRLLDALGAQGVLPYTEDLLSYGLFDWAITDADVTRVFNTFVNLPPNAREPFLAGLNAAGRLGRLIDNATVGHHALYIQPWIATLTPGALTPRQRQILRTIVENTSDDALDTLLLATHVRFNVTVGRGAIPGYPKPIDWKPDSLRKTYLTLDTLPEAHVAENANLIRFGQFEQPAHDNLITGGVYYGPLRELDINAADEGDVAHDAIHETGHSVDRTLGWSTGPEPAKSTRGGWLSYGVNYNTTANDMVFDSNGGVRSLLTLPQRLDVVSEMATAMGNRSAQGLAGRIRALPWYAGLPGATKRAVENDRALDALRIGLNVPWFRAADGGEHLATHVYQESYPSTWVRYEHQARARKVSDYQFRDPGEWFAEAYAFYYLPDSRGKGAKLNDKDPDTKRYFDNVVDKVAPTR
jgi:hypothetical protein